MSTTEAAPQPMKLSWWVSGDTNAAADVFVHDRETGATELVSVAENGASGNQTSVYPAISADEISIEITDAGGDNPGDDMFRLVVKRNGEVVEEFDDTYYEFFRSVERESRELTGGVRHLYEARMKEELSSRM